MGQVKFAMGWDGTDKYVPWTILILGVDAQLSKCCTWSEKSWELLFYNKQFEVFGEKTNRL